MTPYKYQRVHTRRSFMCALNTGKLHQKTVLAWRQTHTGKSLMLVVCGEPFALDCLQSASENSRPGRNHVVSTLSEKPCAAAQVSADSSEFTLPKVAGSNPPHDPWVAAGSQTSENVPLRAQSWNHPSVSPSLPWVINLSGNKDWLENLHTFH